MRRAAHAVESKAVVRIEAAVSPRPCLGCAVELALHVYIFLLLWRGCIYSKGAREPSIFWGRGFYCRPSSAPPKTHGPAPARRPRVYIFYTRDTAS
jgi:hypothetical protein